MSWSPDLFIGELRPWPDSVHVVRGNTDETRRYFPERKDGQEALERRIDELCAEVEQLKSEFKKMDAWHSQELKAAMDENAKLRNILAHAVMIADLYEGLTDTRLSLDGGIVDCDWLRAWCKKLGIEVPS